MLLKQLMEVYDILDDSKASAEGVAAYLRGIRADANIEIKELSTEKGSTKMIKIRIPGTNGKSVGGTAPTIGLLGRLGGLGARPEMTGFVSDGDGALVALTLAAKILDMQNKGDTLEGDVFISTHVCPDAPTQPHAEAAAAEQSHPGSPDYRSYSCRCRRLCRRYPAHSPD